MAISLVSLNAQLSKEELLPYYIFIGQELTVMRTYIDKIATIYGGKVEYVDSIHLGVKSNLLGSKKVYVLFDDKEFMASENLYNKLFHTKSIVIVVYPSMDKRKSFYKKFEDGIVWFNLLDTQQLVPIVKQYLRFSNAKNYTSLIEVCENSLGRILLERDKILCYCKVKNINEDVAFNILLNNGVITQPNEVETIMFVKAVSNRDKDLVFSQLPLMNPDENIKVLTYLYNELKLFYLVQSYNGNMGKISQEIGLNWVIIKEVVNAPKRYSVDALEESLLLIVKIINNIKQGLIDNKVALAYTILKIMC